MWQGVGVLFAMIYTFRTKPARHMILPPHPTLKVSRTDGKLFKFYGVL
jgi:hypothetical protein